MKTFRNSNPARTYTGPVKAKYGDYREYLVRDFKGRCGYTDCSHAWWGGGFQIDHFAPKKPKLSDKSHLPKFQALINDYSNLVYACPQVNRAKWNDWPSNDPSIPVVGGQGYLDPCLNLNDYFERTDSGGIRPKDHPVAKYMWSKLKLYLLRYELYWRMEQLAARLDRLDSFRVLPNLPKSVQAEILTAIADLTREYRAYFRYLETNYMAII
jgi:hypothetical protein